MYKYPVEGTEGIYGQMEIHGFVKTTLLDYPGHLAATIFTGGCNFRCPFCHNASLVLSPAAQPVFDEEQVFDTLRKRTGILEGVCITGGEPTLYSGLTGFIRRIKELGYLVKLDTNGNNPHIIKELVKNGYLDYVAMDIKNSRANYGLSNGLSGFDTRRIEESVSFLLSGSVEYEFRTTVVREHHTGKDMLEIGKWLEGAEAYFLQPYKDSGDVILSGLTAPSKTDMDSYKDLLKPYIKNVEIRGIN
jgi:pyruvate formate lyase activating enzyme